jgi:hypothetical protein
MYHHTFFDPVLSSGDAARPFSNAGAFINSIGNLPFLPRVKSALWKRTKKKGVAESL